MSCKYKGECPSASGWCEGPKQNFERCIPFLVSSADRWKLEAQKQAAEAGEMRIALAVRLEELRTNMNKIEQRREEEDKSVTKYLLGMKIETLREQAAWIESVLNQRKMPEWIRKVEGKFLGGSRR